MFRGAKKRTFRFGKKNVSFPKVETFRFADYIAEIANHELLGTSGEITWSGVAGNGSPLQAGVYIFYAEIYHPDGIVKRFKEAFLIR